MSGTLVDLQAARIERCLQDNGVSARVWQATIARRFIRFDLTIAAGTKVSRVTALEEELAMSLGVDAVRIDREAGVILVEVPRTDGKRGVTLAELDAMFQKDRQEGGRQPGRMTAVLGLDVGGLPLMLRMDSPDVAHILLAGTTGSGKTELAKTIIASLIQRNPFGQLQFILLDPKGTKLAPFSEMAHCRLHAVTPAEQVAALAYAVDEMDRRQLGATPYLLIVIDELADLLQTNPEAANLLLRLTQVGREYRIQVIAATQRPAAALVGGMVKANFPLRLVGSVVSTDDAKVAAGLPGTGAERLLGRGDFLLVAKGNVIRFQAAQVGAEQLNRLQVNKGGKTMLARQLQAALPGWASGASGVGGVGGPAPAAPATATAAGGDSPTHPPTHPPAPLAVPLALQAGRPVKRQTLEERYPPTLLYAAYLAQGRNKKAACSATFGYSDSKTLGLMAAAIDLHETGQEVIQ
jgi:S-DNA-T family DNA segregation ATPase FtsK/SpoIIIE